jgi:hypothetical protein
MLVFAHSFDGALPKGKLRTTWEKVSKERGLRWPNRRSIPCLKPLSARRLETIPYYTSPKFREETIAEERDWRLVYHDRRR